MGQSVRHGKFERSLSHLGFIQTALLFAQNALSQLEGLGSTSSRILRSQVARNAARGGVGVRVRVLWWNVLVDTANACGELFEDVRTV
jgi:hypothetical protein